MPPALTEIERKILDFMVQYLRENTYQPSIREIGERFGIKSTKTVSEHLQALATKGYLERDPSRSRGVRILDVDLHPQTVSVPCYARIPRDGGRPGQGGAEMYLTLDRRLAGEKGGFFVRADDDALAPLGVGRGDFVLVEPASPESLEEGAVVVARVGEEPGYYRYAPNGSGAVLEPFRRDEEPTAVEDRAAVPLVGRVAAVYRRIDPSATSVGVTRH